MKKIVLLQGPVGGYFRYLHERLEQAGFKVRRLVFNGGDIVFALGSKFELVRPQETSYEQAIEEIIHGWPADAVILFGDERPIHRAARQAARHAGVPVYCLEEGYLRPDYVTFELGGNNANSPLLATFDPDATPPEVPKVPALPASTIAMARAAILYFGALRLSRPFFPRYQHHRERRLRSEFRYWTRSLWRRLMAQRHDRRFTAGLAAPEHPPFFVVALQVHDDMQLIRHGRSWSTRSFLEAVLQSFRRAAPADCHLVIKAHPLDVGYGHHKKNLRYLVEENDLGGRVVFLQSGPLLPVVRHARGLVTVNSTAGIAALECGVPVLAFGNALYHARGLAERYRDERDIDAFWVDPPTVDTDRAQRFNAHVRLHALVPGSFYLSDTWPSMTEEIIARLRKTLGG
jgi:capsular polysaccharide export protein